MSLLFLAGCPRPPPSEEIDGGETPQEDGGIPSGPTVVRVLAGNISSGNMQSYDPGEGQRILQGLKPDVALLQELNYGDNTAASLRAWVNATFGQSYEFFVEPSANAQIPNAVVSRYPIRESGAWDDPATNTREFAYARIDLPGDVDLWAISVHLLTANPTQRMTQAASLMTYIDALPVGDFVVIGGDLNTDTRNEPCLTTLGTSFRTTAPFPVDQAGNGNTNLSRAKPYDWVIADTELDAIKTPLKLGDASFPDGLVFDTRVYMPLSDVAPALATDSSATNMQHMAVVRDFLVP
ncbi:MAG: endonuclease/exonuclease/phosphatase family protein [Myxococcaceae bacterium]